MDGELSLFAERALVFHGPALKVPGLFFDNPLPHRLYSVYECG